MKNFFIIIIVLPLLASSCFKNEDNKIEEETVTSGVLKIATDVETGLYTELQINEFTRVWNKATFQSTTTSTLGAIEKLLNKEIDAITISRPLTAREEKYFDEMSVGIVKLPIAINAVCFVVNQKNPLKNITIEQLQSIYRGDIKNWKELGGVDKKIDVYATDKNDAQFHILRDSILKQAILSSQTYIVASSNDVRQYVEKNENAIGFVGMGQVRNRNVPTLIDTSKVKFLAVYSWITKSFLKPVQANVYNRDYPLTHTSYFVYISYRSLAKGFGAFLIKEGQKIFARNGISPIQLPIVVINFKEEL